MLAKTVLLAALCSPALALPLASQHRAHDIRLDSPQYKAKLATAQQWLDSLPNNGTVPTRTANSTMRVRAASGSSGPTEHTVIECSDNTDNPTSCSFTALRDDEYHFVFAKYDVAVAVISPSAIQDIYVSGKPGTFLGDCCDSGGKAGSGDCHFQDVEILHYTAGCEQDNGYSTLVLDVYLKANQGVTILSPGGDIGFW